MSGSSAESSKDTEEITIEPKMLILYVVMLIVSYCIVFSFLLWVQGYWDEPETKYFGKPQPRKPPPSGSTF